MQHILDPFLSNAIDEIIFLTECLIVKLTNTKHRLNDFIRRSYSLTNLEIQKNTIHLYEIKSLIYAGKKRIFKCRCFYKFDGIQKREIEQEIINFNQERIEYEKLSILNKKISKENKIKMINAINKTKPKLWVDYPNKNEENDEEGKDLINQENKQSNNLWQNEMACTRKEIEMFCFE